MDGLTEAVPLVQLLLLPLYVLGLYGIISYFTARKKTEGTRVNWTPLEAVSITVATYFAAQFIAAVGLGLFLATQNRSFEQASSMIETSVTAQFLFVLAVEAITAGAIVAFMRRRATPLQRIGLVKPRLSRDVPLALAGYAVYFVAYIILLVIIEQLVPSLNLDQRQELGFSTDTVGAGLVLIFVSLVILPPLVEEFLVRGFLYSGLRARLSVFWAAIITGALFAAAHLQFGSGNPLLYVAAIDTFILSLVLVYLREKTGSLWPPIGVHMLKNGVAFLVLFVFKANI